MVKFDTGKHVELSTCGEHGIVLSQVGSMVTIRVLDDEHEPTGEIRSEHSKHVIELRPVTEIVAIKRAILSEGLSRPSPRDSYRDGIRRTSSSPIGRAPVGGN